MKLFLYCFRDFDETEFFDELQKTHDFTYATCAEYPNLQNASLAAGYDAVSVTPTPMGRDMLEKFHSLGVKYILTRSIGYEHIDLQAAAELGMHVSRVAYDPDTVADFSVMLMLMLLRNMHQIIDRSDVQDYSLFGKRGRDIGDCTIGVIGTGGIGMTVIRHLQGFGCRILACSTHEAPHKTELCEYVTRDELLRQSDVITLHVPGKAENFHLLDADAFARMKQDVCIVNTARGSLIDENALIDALESGKVHGAALDVLEDERGLIYIDRTGDCIANRQMAILRSFPNVMFTGHTAFYTRKVIRSMAECTVRCMFAMRDGREDPLIII